MAIISAGKKGTLASYSRKDIFEALSKSGSGKRYNEHPDHSKNISNERKYNTTKSHTNVRDKSEIKY